MRLTIWGCRGSLATPGPETLRYGGNTSCVELRGADGSLLVLDAGTGIRQLGHALRPDAIKTIYLMITHLHLDHIEGLGFFAPLHNPDVEIHVYGPAAGGRSLRDRIAAYLSPPWYPLRFEELAARFSFHEVERDTWEIGGLRISSAPVTHPGPTLGYRIEENDRSFAFVPDNEPALDGPIGDQPDGALSGLAVAAGVDLLFHDAQYTAGEYASRAGWGHSSILDFAAFVGRADPARVLMFHHDPAHSDDDLDAMHAEARRHAGVAGDRIDIAHEGLELELI
ncbi:MAG: MBL fold metallo-hydrolase [Actinobacteria bacterium]|nr:MBL fold metallo-hydrolase [Actinomycetota bacterium]